MSKLPLNAYGGKRRFTLSDVSETEHSSLNSPDQTPNGWGLRERGEGRPRVSFKKFVPLSPPEFDLYKISSVNSVTPIRSWCFGILTSTPRHVGLWGPGKGQGLGWRHQHGETVVRLPPSSGAPCTELGLRDTEPPAPWIFQRRTFCLLYVIYNTLYIVRLYCILFNM